MTSSPLTLDDDILRAFLRGTLPAERADEVRAWLDADPNRSNRLDRLTASDALTDPIADPRLDAFKLSLPPNVGNRYVAPESKPCIATMVLFACTTPLVATSEEIEKWFKDLPELPLLPGGGGTVVRFVDYLEAREPLGLGTLDDDHGKGRSPLPRGKFGELGSHDALARWQGQLQKHLGDKAALQLAVSLARMGGRVRCDNDPKWPF